MGLTKTRPCGFLQSRSPRQTRHETMKILCVDIGTGTQDILLYDSRVHIENCYKLVAPSPTMMVRRRLQAATRSRRPVLLTGMTMGGGPNMWAAQDHLQAGLPLYATPQAARSFNDDLDVIRDMGIQVIAEEEADRLPEDVVRVSLRDFDFQAIVQAFGPFGVSLDDLAAVAVAVFDHGAAPPEISDRQFRFDFLARQIRRDDRLSTFAFLADAIPAILTRMRAVAACAAGIDAPLVVMDTAPAAILGATLDPRSRHDGDALFANIGNLHTLSFRMREGRIRGLFEHHTGMLNRERLEHFLKALADGSLRHDEVFADHGHGAHLIDTTPLPATPPLIVTGPRRQLLAGSALHPYFATPFGDMMLAGCYGLLAATAERLPHLAEPILESLQGRAGRPPWETD
ncbi:MAG: pyruvate formate lyase-activating protein [Caldilineae bacterium]|nr:MAG: pyruvate formate lyase-activating protein [Caldilineae bacterium]